MTAIAPTLSLPRPAPTVGPSVDAPLRATASVSTAAIDQIRRTMALNFCKWDPQVGDTSVLAPFALVLSSQDWRTLSVAAEELDRETLALEQALLDRPDLHPMLALPRPLRKLFAHGARTPLTPAAARVMRFDFHPTSAGWRISEVNSDVPGGFTEASAFSALMQQHFPQTATPGDPASAYADALAAHGKHVALLVAPGLMDDHQIIANLARLLQSHGVDARLAQPRQLHWRDGRAYLDTIQSSLPIDAIVRFYQAEWLAYLQRPVQWQPLFVAGRTPVANPGICALSESKRVPLLWGQLGVPLRAWPRYLPETHEVCDAPWRTDDRWIVKHAYSNTGQATAARGLTSPKDWRSTKRDTFLHPKHWIAQQRFDTTPIESPLGGMFPCIGVYTINGRVAGIYGRIAPRPIIDYRALDVAVLIDPTSQGNSLTADGRR